MQVVMSDSAGKAQDILRELSQLLASPYLPVQQKIAEELGVDQPFVSNARAGKLRRITPRVVRLREYVNMRIQGVHAAANAAAEIEAEFTEEVANSITRRPQGLHKRRSGQRYEDDALAGVKAYLQDGYDPRLIVEQLAVLRRAQRVRSPGRPPSTAVDDESV